ncbi:FHA domain-containing protein [bacterium]|nr:FHA domain-containing protein [bacterium]
MKRRGLVLTLGVVFIVLGFFLRSFAVSKVERFVTDTPGAFFASVLGIELGVFIIIALLSYMSRIRKKTRNKVTKKKEHETEVERKHELFEHVPKGEIEANLPLVFARLVVEGRYGAKEEYELHVNKEIIIGRYNSNDIIINGIGVSRVHAKIRPEREGYILYDMASESGTIVNGRKIERHHLRNNDEILIARIKLTFKKDSV